MVKRRVKEKMTNRKINFEKIKKLNVVFPENKFNPDSLGGHCVCQFCGDVVEIKNYLRPSPEMFHHNTKHSDVEFEFNCYIFAYPEDLGGIYDKQQIILKQSRKKSARS